MNRYWCRFYALTSEMPAFEYHGPWWISGTTMDDDEQSIVCCAVQASNEDAAKRTVDECFDPGHAMKQWDGAIKRGPEWEPFIDRFPRRSWMRWPFPISCNPTPGGEGGR